MNRQWHIGIIGYGWAAGAHIRAINSLPNAQVTGVYSSRRLDSMELSARHGSDILYYAELDALLNDPTIHVVSICTGHADHPRQAIAAAEAGKHLIIEKPIGLTLEDCRAVARTVVRAGVRACVCFECRFSNQFMTTKTALDQGLLGELHYGEVDYYHGIGPWYGQYRWNIHKAGGGSSLLTAGCHALDGLLHFLGEDVQEVQTYATRSRHPDFARYEYPTTTVTLLKFRSGRVGKVASVVDCLQPYYFHVHLVGSAGSLLDDRFYSAPLLGTPPSAWGRLPMKLLDSGDVADHPYARQFAAFLAALERGEEMPETSLRQALRTHEVIFAADRSAAEGRPVRLDEIQAG